MKKVPSPGLHGAEAHPGVEAPTSRDEGERGAARAVLLLDHMSQPALPLKPKVLREDEVWILRVEQPNGKVQEFRCATESQAKQLALLFSTAD